MILCRKHEKGYVKFQENLCFSGSNYFNSMLVVGSMQKSSDIYIHYQHCYNHWVIKLGGYKTDFNVPVFKMLASCEKMKSHKHKGLQFFFSVVNISM